MQIGAAFEDRAFEDVVVPLVERVAREENREVGLLATRLTHGCRFRDLSAILTDLADRVDGLIIGADTRDSTPAKKEQAMRERVGKRLGPLPVIFALPQPCAEGWLIADLGALKRGVAEQLGEAVALPARAGRYPRGEQAAKDRLRSLLRQADVPFLSGGLEYGHAVMHHVRYEAHPSLKRFVAQLRQLLHAR